MALPTETVTVDIHCVTRWSKLDTQWRGVSLDTLLADVETAADFALVHSYGGYTTNLPLEDLLDGQAWVAFEYDGDDLRPEHGGPARLLVPAPLLLEVRQVGARHRADARGRSPASGSSSATTTTATHGASSGTRGTERRGAPGGDAALVERRTETASARDPRPRRRRTGRATCPASTSTCG